MSGESERDTGNSLETPSCILCGGTSHRPLFSKTSPSGGSFTLVTCAACGLRFISPRPTPAALAQYYQGSYFTTRTDRGYDNYFSEDLMREITRVLLLNLQDLGFFEYEKTLEGNRRSLDIGCAAGYSVRLMDERGWDSRGIDIAGECIRFGREQLGLRLQEGDYLAEKFPDRFQLITLWATIEHLHRPDLVLKKAYGDLAPGGMLYLSTCRAGGFMKIFDKDWRYYNFPEHLYYFTYRQLKQLLIQCGFTVTRRAFYGSGVGKPRSALRKSADWAARHLQMGDMMIVAARKFE